MYHDRYVEEWHEYFAKNVPENFKIRVLKKIQAILNYPQKRHLSGKARFFVDDVGQYRITYRIFEQENQVRFYFVGDHKEYEKWYSQFF